MFLSGPGEMSSVGQSSPAGAGHVTGRGAAGTRTRGPLAPWCRGELVKNV